MPKTMTGRKIYASMKKTYKASANKGTIKSVHKKRAKSKPRSY